MRFSAILLAVAFCAAPALATTDYVTGNAGFEDGWTEDPNYVGYTSGVHQSNTGFEWWGSQAWNLPGWNGDGTHDADEYYNSGQYAKDARDFTLPKFGGTVPAHVQGDWFAWPGWTLSERPDKPGSGDMAMVAQGNRPVYYITASAPAPGTRVAVRFDYFADHNKLDPILYGMNDYNDIRTPFWGWDKDEDGDVLESMVYPGPDILTGWDSSANSGEIIFEEEAVFSGQGAVVSDAAEWKTFAKMFTMPTPTDGRSATEFDFLAFEAWMWVSGNGAEDTAIDNLSIVEVPDGDANLDGKVTDADYTVWADNFGATGATWQDGDFNGDGEVTDADYTIWADNFGAGVDVTPEPATLSLLGLGAVALIRRKR